MSTDTSTDFDLLKSKNEEGGVDAMLEALVEQLRAKRQPHQLFEALKMQVRQQMALPLQYTEQSDDLTDEQREQLENGLLEACREVGAMLLKDGQIREGWMYLRPVGDREAASAMLAEIEPDDENLDDLVEVLLGESVDVARGFRLVIENFGICNAITTFESQLGNHGRREQQAAAGLLVRHLHHELCENLATDIGRQEGATPTGESSIRSLVADREWLFNENTYHVDTTHLSSVVRFARLLDDPETLRLALDLTEYGRHLSTQFQYQSDEPFADNYPAHAIYFRGLLGEDVDQAIEYFGKKAETVDQGEFGTLAIEVFVDLLSRLGRHQEAIDAAIRLSPADARPLGIAPSLLELSQRAQQFDQMLDFCRQQNDLLGYATGLAYHAAKK
ncbi:hypothetical protein [Lignipirellula cremea]|uniref:Uncharacterized protein n=1 Tax=Lignipirellula cremea TaxID=2528010 RepID=A0A518E2M9_9BACT|nr:hypothetical protein [Lignipirellula cremea]QDU98334.1 hypothetical protein Pla8534_62010 [Lignipirellula cremea]